MFFIQTPATNIYTNAGQQLDYKLPDQSSVSLNADAQITFNTFTFDEQRVVKLYGEAFFDVVQGDSFKVYTDHGMVLVKGTSFGVLADPYEFRVSCKTGQVEVKDYGKEKITLNAGDQVRFRDSTFLAIEKVSPSIIASWRNGESKFKSEPLKNVIRAVEKQFDIRIHTDTTIIKQKFTGSFLHKDVDTAMKMIFIPMEVKYKKEKENVYKVF